MQWNKTIGGIGYDKAWRVIKTSDGNYVFAGITNSFGAGGNDYWILKTDSLGELRFAYEQPLLSTPGRTHPPPTVWTPAGYPRECSLGPARIGS